MSFHAWRLAARPATLTAALVPVAVGSAVAHTLGGFQWAPALAALLGASLIQIGTNFANDVFDFEQGADTDERLGPTRAVHAGLLSPAAMRKGMWLTFGAAGLCGVYLTWAAGPWIVAIGVASVLSGIAYTGGPFPLGYHGLGDVFVFLFFGFVAVCGTAFVQLHEVSALAWWCSVPVGALATAILVVNNLRDRTTDVKAGKRTLAVRFGRRFAIAEYWLLLLISYGVAIWLAVNGRPWVGVVAITLPWGLWLARRVAMLDGAALNPCLASTAKLLLAFGLLFAAGIAVP